MAGGATRNARKTRKRKNSEDSTSAAPSRTLKQYSVDEKLEIIEFAKGNGNRAAGREYNVAESSIREWRKNEEKLRAANSVESERNRLPNHQYGSAVEQIMTNTNETDADFVQVSLSSSLSNVRSGKTDGMTTSVRQESTSNESSSSSSHSNSPVLNLVSSSSRRKAKTPRKIVIES